MANFLLDLVRDLSLLSELLCLVKPLVVLYLLLVLFVDFNGEVCEEIRVDGSSCDHNEAIDEPLRVGGRYYVAIT